MQQLLFRHSERGGFWPLVNRERWQ